MFYYIILPLFIFGLIKKIIFLKEAILTKNYSMLKAELFFLFLNILVFIGMIYLIKT